MAIMVIRSTAIITKCRSITEVEPKYILYFERECGFDHEIRGQVSIRSLFFNSMNVIINI